MECPKCGFQQPEDEFCAQCGVHIRRAGRARRRKTLFLLAVTVVLVAGGAVALTLWLSGRAQVGAPSLSVETGSRPSIHRIEPPPPPPTPPPPPKAQKVATPAPAGAEKKGTRTKGQGAPAPSTTSPIGEGSPAPEPASAPSSPSPESKSAGAEMEGQLRRWAAQEWVTKGREQADNPEQALSMYRKALEVEPHFAPAYYHIGVLYWGGGDRDAALEALRKFWGEATQEEKESLPLPDGVSLEDLGVAEGGQEAR